ncbi:hypothetical protein Celaphus_00007881, partial [Cervus elaphus hippelaphus]
MFQLWKLVLLCGLLAGTSASLLNNHGNSFLRTVNSGLESRLGIFDSTSENIPCNGHLERETHVGNVKRLLHLCSLPLLGDIVDLGLKVDLQTSVSIETDAETGDPKVVVGECTNNPESISLTVLHRRFRLLSDAVDLGVNLVRQLVSSVVHNELCPRIHELLESLDAECVKKLI